MRWHRQLIALFALSPAACSGDRFPLSADAGVGVDASDAATVDGAGASEGGVGGDAALGPHVSCGPSTCKLSETCCVYVNLSGAQYDCRSACPAAQGADQLSALKCSGTADCGSGRVCCVERSNPQNVSVCSATPCGSNQVQLCDPSTQAASGCPVNAPCSGSNINDWKLPGTFGTCGGVGVP